MNAVVQTILPYLPFAGLFIGVLIAFEGLRQTVARRTDIEAARSARIRQIMAENGGKMLLMHHVKPDTWQARIPVFGTLGINMRQAGMKMGVRPFIAACAFSGAVTFLIWSQMLGFGVAVLPALLIGAGLPVMVVANFKRRRLERFTAQLPDALDLMMRGLRVGHPINSTLSNVVENMEDPISTEFKIMADQVAYGEDLVSAFMALAERVDQEDMYYLAASVGIQHGTGGNLATMLSTLSRVIRNRAMMRRRIKAISSEGRISAVILSGLPLLIFGFTSFSAPGYYTGVQDDPMFMPMAIAIVFFLVTNFLVLRKLSSFRV
ncbi:MAG: type II secretion system F family protein [Paracoccaceae bacterium]